MPGNLQPEDRTAWLLLIGRRLRAEYAVLAEPVPPRLAALIEQLETSKLETPAQDGSNRGAGHQDGSNQDGSSPDGKSAAPADNQPCRTARA